MTLYSVYARQDRAPVAIADSFRWFAAAAAAGLCAGPRALAAARRLGRAGGGAVAALGWYRRWRRGVLGSMSWLPCCIGFEAPAPCAAAPCRHARLAPSRATDLAAERTSPASRRWQAQMSTVTIIDYGSGNLRSAAKAFERAAREAGAETEILVTDDPDVVRRADRIVLPGVGAFADCRAGLDAVTGMVEALEERVIRGGVPFLGICVGMQLMADRRPREGGHAGPRLDPRRGASASSRAGGLKIPHMGWNTLTFDRAAPAARRHPRRRRPACTPISSTPITSRPTRPRRRWSPRPTTAQTVTAMRRPRQHVRHAVPPRKEPDARAER